MKQMNRSVETALNSPRAELCLRPYRLEDGDRIVTWCAGEGDFYKWSAGKLGAYPLTPARFNQSVAARENGYFPFVLDEDGKAVGFFILRQPGEDTDVLRFGFVILDPSFRGKGYGKKMLAFGIRHAFQDCGEKK